LDHLNPEEAAPAGDSSRMPSCAKAHGPKERESEKRDGTLVVGKEMAIGWQATSAEAVMSCIAEH